MKTILLASASIVAFAGAAAAEVNFGGDAELGYNDDIEGGFYWNFGLSVDASQELDNGLTASISIDIDTNNTDTFDGGSVDASDFVLELSAENASLSFGDVDYAADSAWSGVTNMEADSFAEAGDAGEDGVLNASVSFGGVEAAVSYALIEGTDNLDALTVGATAELGMATVIVAYEDDFISGDDVMGVAVAGTFGGVDGVLAYADNGTETSIGVEGTYSFGDVAVTAFYVSNDVADDNYGVEVAYAAGALSIEAFYHDGNDEDMGIHAGYDLGNGLELFAGYSDDDGQYVAGEYDLGGGAGLTVAYAEDEDNAANDEIGPNEYMHGTTVAVSFDF